MKNLLTSILLLCSLSMFIACGNNQMQPGESLSVYLEALTAGDYHTYSKGLYGLEVADTLTGDSLRPNLMKVYSKYMQEKYQGLQSFEIVTDSLSDNGEQATLRVKLLFGDGEAEETEFEMIKDGDEWKINLAS